MYKQNSKLRKAQIGYLYKSSIFMALQFIYKLHDLQLASGAGMCIHIYFKRMNSSSIAHCPGLPLICPHGEDRPLFRWLVTCFTLQRYWS